MKDYKHVTAEWAKNTAESIETEKASKEINEILAKIENCANQNLHGVTISDIMVVNQKELRKRGFGVSYNDGGMMGNGDFRITWK